MKKHLLVLCAVFLVINSNSYASNIGILDVEKIVKESKAMKDIQRKVNEKQEDYQKEVTKKQDALEQEQKRIESKKSVLSSEALEKEVREFEVKVEDLRKFVDRRQNSLKKASLDGMSKVNDEIKEIISKIAEEKKLDVIVPSAQALYYKDSLDISTETLERLDKKITKVKISFE